MATSPSRWSYTTSIRHMASNVWIVLLTKNWSCFLAPTERSCSILGPLAREDDEARYDFFPKAFLLSPHDPDKAGHDLKEGGPDRRVGMPTV